MRRLNSTEQPEPSSSPGDESPVCGLLAALDEAATLLRAYGVEGWAAWLEDDRRRIAEGHHDALDHLLSAFGGMGSLNDVELHWRRDDLGDSDLGRDDVLRDDDRLNELRTRIYSEAVALRSMIGDALDGGGSEQTAW